MKIDAIASLSLTFFLNLRICAYLLVSLNQAAGIKLLEIYPVWDTQIAVVGSIILAVKFNINCIYMMHIF